MVDKLASNIHKTFFMNKENAEKVLHTVALLNNVKLNVVLKTLLYTYLAALNTIKLNKNIDV